MLWQVVRRHWANPPNINEAEFFAEVERVGGIAVVWRKFQQRLPLDGSLAMWLRPLLRWLDYHEQEFKADIVALPEVQNHPDLARWLTDQASQALSKQDLLTALASWRGVVAVSPAGPLSRQAWNGMWAVLQKLDEPGLRKQTLQGVIIHGNDPDLAAQASTFLQEEYLRQDRPAALLSLLAWELEQQRSASRVNRLANLLAANGLERLALTAAMLVPEAQRDPALVAALALQFGWLQSHAQAVARLPAAEQKRWSGWRAWQQGETELATELWRQAGAGAENLLQHQEQGRLLATGAVSEAQLAQWWSNHPGPYEWLSPPDLIQTFQDSHDYVAETSALVARMFRSVPGKPVVVYANGPTLLKLEIRPAHSRGDPDRLSGWAAIAVGKQTMHLAITANPPSQGLLAKRQDSPLPGIATSRELLLPAGPQQVVVSSDSFPLLVRAWQQQPRYPLALLPRPVKPEPFLPPAPDPLQELTELLWMFEQNPAESAAIMVKAEDLFTRFPVSIASQALIQRLRLGSEWSPLEHLESSAGVQWLTQDSWLPESPSLRTLASLLPPGAANSRLLAGWKRMVLVTKNSVARRIGLSLSWEAAAFMPLHSTTVAVVVDAGKQQLIHLDAAQARTVVPLHLSAGEHSIAMEMRDPVVSRFLRLALVDQDGHALPWNLRRDQQLLYQVASHAEPLLVHVAGPAVLRVDSWDDGLHTSRQQLLAAGWQQLRLVPAKDKELAFYRLFQRQLPDRPKPQSRLPQRFDIILQQDLPRSVAIPILPEPTLNTAGASHEGTWSLDGRYQLRQDGGEDAASDGLERFKQLSLTHRTHDDNTRTYQQWGSLLRTAEQGNATFGAWLEQRHLAPLYPVNWRLRLEGFAQDIPGHGLQGVATLRAGLSRLEHLTEALDSLTDLSAFGHLPSLHSDLGLAASQVDKDVVSSYRLVHPYGLTLSESFKHRPWLDTWWTLLGGVISNADLNLLQAEQLFVRARWEQLFASTQLAAQYNLQRYLPDADRQNGINRYGPEITVTGDLFPRQGDRLQWSVNFRHEQSSGENVGFLGLTWHFTDNYLRDFAPGEVDFRDLRFWFWPEHANQPGQLQ